MGTQEHGRVRFERDGEIAILTLDRPSKLNAYTPEMFEELSEHVETFEHDEGLRVAILTGAGQKSFCAGADLGETVSKITSGAPRHFSDITKRFFSTIYKPVIAAVNGICIAGGLEMMGGTDLRIAVPDATFGLGEVRWGITPGGGSHIRLPRQIHGQLPWRSSSPGAPSRLSAAYEIGLINKIVEPKDLLDEALSLARTIASNAPLAVQAAKEIAVRGMGLEGPRLEYYISGRVLTTEDAKEGPRAFAEKRPPRYQGR